MSNHSWTGSPGQLTVDEILNGFHIIPHQHAMYIHPHDPGTYPDGWFVRRDDPETGLHNVPRGTIQFGAHNRPDKKNHT